MELVYSKKTVKMICDLKTKYYKAWVRNDWKKMGEIEHVFRILVVLGIVESDIFSIDTNAREIFGLTEREYGECETLDNLEEVYYQEEDLENLLS